MAAGNNTKEVDNVLKKLMGNPGVTKCLILNADGIAIKAVGMESKTAVQYCALVNDLVQKSQAAMAMLMDPSESAVEYLRLHTSNKKELIISPGKDYTVVAVQDGSMKGGAGAAEDSEKKSDDK